MKILISESQLKYLLYYYNKNYNYNLSYITESVKKSELPKEIQNAIKQIENTYNVTITDDNIQKEFDQEGSYYPDNGKIDSKAFTNLKNLLNDLYKNFPNAPKDTNVNCDNLPGCVSGYRGYSTQATTFGSKIKSQGGVSGRQKASAIPGFSQHSTGKTFDILNLDPSWWNARPDLKNWVATNVCKYGFKVTYLTDGVLRMAEPWHIYYTGDFCNKENKTTETKSTKSDLESKEEKFKKFFENYFEFLKTNKTVDQKSPDKKITMMQVVLFMVTKDKLIDINGKFDDNTKNVVINFQKNNGLSETGIFDLKTQDVLTQKIFKTYQGRQVNDEKKGTGGSEENITGSNVKLDPSSMMPASSKRGKTYGWRAPIQSLCAQGINTKRYCNWHWHAGRDYAGTRGTPIVLLKGGKMIENKSYCFKIEHNDGTITKYCHCDDVYFNQGDEIPAGTIFATLGNKGPSTGPHLHFEYYPPGDNTRTETKNGKSQQVKDVDPSGVDDTIFAFVKPGNENKYMKKGGKI